MLISFDVFLWLLNCTQNVEKIKLRISKGNYYTQCMTQEYKEAY